MFIFHKIKQLIDPWFRVLRNCLPVICCYWRRCIYNCLPNLWVNKRGYILSVRQFHNYRCGLLIRRLWLPVTSLQNYLSFITEPLIGIKVSIWNDLSNLIYTIFDEWREKWMKLQFFIFLYDKWDNYSLWPHTKAQVLHTPSNGQNFSDLTFTNKKHSINHVFDKVLCLYWGIKQMFEPILLHDIIGNCSS